MFRGPIVWESAALSALCLADMGSTMWLVGTKMAVEANPVLGYYMSHGTWVFAAMKVFMLIGPLIALEWIRMRRPTFVRNMMRAGVALYLLIYVTGVFTLNSAGAQRRAIAANRRTREHQVVRQIV